jgi:hypothetical protein
MLACVVGLLATNSKHKLLLWQEHLPWACVAAVPLECR